MDHETRPSRAEEDHNVANSPELSSAMNRNGSSATLTPPISSLQRPVVGTPSQTDKELDSKMDPEKEVETEQEEVLYSDDTVGRHGQDEVAQGKGDRDGSEEGGWKKAVGLLRQFLLDENPRRCTDSRGSEGTEEVEPPPDGGWRAWGAGMLILPLTLPLSLWFWFPPWISTAGTTCHCFVIPSFGHSLWHNPESLPSSPSTHHPSDNQPLKY
jgi:hypothetical protein